MTDKNSLSDRTVVITGAARGLGAEAARLAVVEAARTS